MAGNEENNTANGGSQDESPRNGPTAEQGAKETAPAQDTVQDTAQATQEEGAPNGAQEAGQGAAPAQDAGPTAAELEQALNVAKINYERYLRAEAELENFKKRMRREQEETLKFALSPLLKDLFGIVDNLERALEHANDESGSLAEGIEMVNKQLQDILTNHGVRRIEAKGQAFDPNLHDAMSMVESQEMEENMVVDEFQAGYELHGRVLRPARVSVSKKAGG